MEVVVGGVARKQGGRDDPAVVDQGLEQFELGERELAEKQRVELAAGIEIGQQIAQTAQIDSVLGESASAAGAYRNVERVVGGHAVRLVQAGEDCRKLLAPGGHRGGHHPRGEDAQALAGQIPGQILAEHAEAFLRRVVLRQAHLELAQRLLPAVVAGHHMGADLVLDQRLHARTRQADVAVDIEGAVRDHQHGTDVGVDDDIDMEVRRLCAVPVDLVLDLAAHFIDAAIGRQRLAAADAGKDAFGHLDQLRFDRTEQCDAGLHETGAVALLDQIDHAPEFALFFGQQRLQGRGTDLGDGQGVERLACGLQVDLEIDVAHGRFNAATGGFEGFPQTDTVQRRQRQQPVQARIERGQRLVHARGDIRQRAGDRAFGHHRAHRMNSGRTASTAWCRPSRSA